MRFEFAAPGRIIFSPGSFSRAAELALSLGRRPLLAAGKRRGHLAPLAAALTAAGAAVTDFTVSGEPDTDAIEAGLALARSAGVDSVIAVGGGSVLDAAKAVAALLFEEGGLFDHLEVIGKARPLTGPGAPLLAVPTTAGTGSEATCNAVILSPAHGVKVSLRGRSLFPAVALVDPELTASLPPEETAASGLDALTQLIEPFVSAAANPFTDALCRDGLRRAGRALRRAFADGNDREARLDMSLAALESGMALANARLGAVHGLAGPLGGLIRAPHGRLCAALLAAVMETNVRLLKERGENEPALRRYEEIAGLLTGRPGARLEDGAAWVRETCRELSIQSLSLLGMTRSLVGAAAAKARQASSMKGNPILLEKADLEAILIQSL